MRPVEVAAAVIRKNGSTLICSRPRNTALGGFFEFPGGKCEPGETLSCCVVRELQEELGITVVPFDTIHVLTHVYPDKTVRVHFIRCMIASGTPSPLDQQEIRWVSTAELAEVPFLPADLPLAELLAESARNLQKNPVPLQ